MVYYARRQIVIQWTMTLTVRLPNRVEQKLAEYCANRNVSKSDAVKEALELLLESDRVPAGDEHPFVGADKGDGTDVSGNVKTLVRSRLRSSR